ncbi:MAG: hypothetical protein ABIU06_08980 [Anaerolineales bacterium]
MSEDFYVNYSCASQRHGIGSRMLREPPNERIDALLPLLRDLLKKNTDPGGTHICPICVQTLDIMFEYIKEFPRELDISSDCKTCNICVFFKSSKIPSWARAISLLEGPGFFD